MKSRSIALLAAVPAALLCTAEVESKRLGILPNTVVNGVNVGSLTRVSTKTCGQCHLASIGGVDVTVAPTSRSILVNQTTAVTVSGTSSTTGSRGGFTADVTKGTFIAGSTTKVNAAASAITHGNSTGRSWAFTWKAPATPGLAELYTVVNAVNGDNRTSGDTHAFHGSSPTNTTSTPVRLYANAASGVKPVGNSCSDGFGNHSVLGSPTVPKPGGTLTLEAFGMQPSAPLLLMLSLGAATPGFDLKPLGAPDCFLYNSIQAEVGLGTGGGNASRSEGSLVLNLPIPNTIPKNFKFTVQYGFIDNNSKRAFKFTTTNALEFTTQ